jgi:hypothetical protein
MLVEAQSRRPHLYRFDERGARGAINSMRLGNDAPPGPALDENSACAEALSARRRREGEQGEQGDKQHGVDDASLDVGRTRDIRTTEAFADCPDEKRVDGSDA